MSFHFKPLSGNCYGADGAACPLRAAGAPMLALDECKKLGIEKVLMACDKENIGSAKSIQNNGGVLENKIAVDGVVEQRYWIELF